MLYNDKCSATDVELRLFAGDDCLSFQHTDSDYVDNAIKNKLSKDRKRLRFNRLFVYYKNTKSLF